MGKLAASALASKASGFSEDTGDFRFLKMLEGWVREAGAQRDVKEPLSPGVLKGLWSQWARFCLDALEAALFHAAAFVAFFGAFWISELVTKSRSDSSCRALQVADVSLGPSSVQFKDGPIGKRGFSVSGCF